MTQNLFLYKSCEVNLNKSASVCDPSNPPETPKSANKTNSSAASILVNDVQAYVTDLNIYAGLIENVPALFVLLFMGPWMTDSRWRKPLIILPAVGYMISILIYIMNDYANDWPAEYILFANVPMGIFAGWVNKIMMLNK